MVLGVPLSLSFQLSLVDPWVLWSQLPLASQHHPELQQDLEVLEVPEDRLNLLGQDLPCLPFVQEHHLCLVDHQILQDHQGQDHHEVH